MPISHLGHAELLVPDLEASSAFFTEIMGLQVSERHEDRLFLRAWQDWDHHTLVLTKSDEPGLAHLGWRVPRKQDADELRVGIEQRGITVHEVDGATITGHGDAYRFTTPGGLPFELYWEVDYYQASGEQVSRMASHPSRIPLTGAAPRRFDHVTFIVDDVIAEQEFLSEVLGIRHNYFVFGPDGTRWGSWLSCNNVSHETAVTRNAMQTGGLLHHVAYYADTIDEVLRAATILVDHGFEIEWGPGKHGTSGATFLYFKEPSGNRMEIWTGGMLIFDPDWKAIEWGPEIGHLGNSMWGTPLPESFRFGTALGEPATANR
ncbi:MAG TPA: VOC family protein [Solirubrobacteraceae bacterium]|jgi:catechol 2,3-dioxygenase|nr:VOC family protein [Solirubrobacteraceae bacterium]